MKPAYTEYTVPRTGTSPLRFMGELISEDIDDDGISRPRWHEISVYRTAKGKYVVWITYVTNWDNETGHDYAIVVDSSDAVEQVLRDYNPTEHVQGYKPTEYYRERQKRLLSDIKKRYDAQVATVLASSPEFFVKVD